MASKRPVGSPPIKKKSKKDLFFSTFRRLYVEEGMSVERIIELKKVSICVNTGYRWVKAYSLAEERERFLAGPESISQEIDKALAQVIAKIRENGGLKKGQADEIAKLATARERLSTKVSFRRAAIRVLDDILEYLNENDHALLVKFAKHLPELREKMRQMYAS